MNKYYVVKSSEESDVKLGVIDALSLEEAHGIATIRYQKKMKSGETIYTFPENELLVFDENNRLVLQMKRVMSLSKW